jgi:hypothetical protein
VIVGQFGSIAKRKCKNNRLTSHIFRLLKEKCEVKRYMCINVHFIMIILVFRSQHRFTVQIIKNECSYNTVKLGSDAILCQPV